MCFFSQRQQRRRPGYSHRFPELDCCPNVRSPNRIIWKVYSSRISFLRRVTRSCTGGTRRIVVLVLESYSSSSSSTSSLRRSAFDVKRIRPSDTIFRICEYTRLQRTGQESNNTIRRATRYSGRKTNMPTEKYGSTQLTKLSK